MKATDLMIGDFVLHDGKVKRVDMIWSKYEVNLYGGETWGSIYNKTDISEVQPIPITHEILYRNGWNYDDLDHEFKGYPRIYGSKALYGIFCCEVNISYVHELQHALRLMGLGELLTLKIGGAV